MICPLPSRCSLALTLAIFGASSLFSATSLGAQSQISSTGTRAAQFVFVIDDSGSMARLGPWGPAADPDRLAVFAIRSLVQMLDESDEVSVVRLNGPTDGEPYLPIRPFGPNRTQILEAVRLEGHLAAYEGKVTPCRTALEAVAELLEAAYRPSVSQVVIFLTDGECTGGQGRSETPSPNAFLDRLRSQKDGLFQFYLLRFQGREYTRELEQLAKASGGGAIEVTSTDPTAMLEPFADALTRSQGYEAEVLRPGRDELEAHRGAKRVRLLAVAPDQGQDLSFSITDRQGRPATLTSDLRTGLHRYQSGKSYRYAALDYRPGTTPVTIRVGGAAGWKVVAVPEYRLFAVMEIRQGGCDAPGVRLEHGVDTGSTICVLARLENEEGQVVEGNVTGKDIQALIRFQLEGQEAKLLAMNPRGTRAEFAFEYRNLEPGFWTIQPTIQLQLAGQTRELRLKTSPRTLQATALQVSATPARLDFGDVRPGDTPPARTVTFRGNFRPTAGRLEVADRGALPSCVTFGLSGKGESEPQPIIVGQAYSLAVRVATYCGPESIQTPFESHLRLVFDRTTTGQTLPTVEIPVRLQLIYDIVTPTKIDLSVQAGNTVRVPVEIRGNQSRPLQLEALIDDRERPSWPGKYLDLGLVVDERGERHRSSAQTLTFDPATAQPARLEVEIDTETCCPSGTYRTEIGLRPRGTDVFGGDPPPPIILPVELQVESSGLWACRGPFILTTVGLILILLVLLYIYSMFRNSSFLSTDRLAKGLTPLLWDTFGAPVRRPRQEAEVEKVVQRGLPLTERFLAWLRANPLVFGLPGRSYNETVELTLQPESQIHRSSVSLLRERDHYNKIQADPSRGTGRLYATAQGSRGHTFYAVVRQGYRIGRLAPERLYDPYGYEEESPKPKLVRLRRREKLIHAISEDEREEGRPAGWQLG